MKFTCSVLFAFLVGQVVSESCPNENCIPKIECTKSPSYICLPCGKGCVFEKKRCDRDELCKSEYGKCVAVADCKPGKFFECKTINASEELLCNGNDCVNVCKIKKKNPNQCPRSKKGGKKCIPIDKCDVEKFDCIPCKGNGKKAQCVQRKSKDKCVTDDACMAAKGKCVTNCEAGEKHKCDTSACGGEESGCACMMMKEKPSCSEDENCTGICASKKCKNKNANCDKSLCGGEDSGCACWISSCSEDVNCTGKCAPDKRCKDKNANCDKSLCGGEDSGCACFTHPNKD